MPDQGASYPSDRDIRKSEAQGDIAADEERRHGYKERGFEKPGGDKAEETSTPDLKRKTA